MSIDPPLEQTSEPLPTSVVTAISAGSPGPSASSGVVSPVVAARSGSSAGCAGSHAESPEAAATQEESAPTISHAAPKVLRCRNTADFLAALPQLTGFTATNSLFVVIFEGNRAGNAVRFDLPRADGPSETAAFLDALTTILHEIRGSSGDWSPAIVITTEQSFAEQRGAPWQRLAQRLHRRLRREGFHLRELCCVASDGWLSFLDSAAPKMGLPLKLIRESFVAAASPSPPLESLGVLPQQPTHRASAVHEALTVQQLPGSEAAAPEASEPGLAVIEDRMFTAVRLLDSMIISPDPECSVSDTVQLVQLANSSTEWCLMAMTAAIDADFVESMLTDLGAYRVAHTPLGLAVTPTAPVSTMRGVLSLIATRAPHIARLTAAIRTVSVAAALAPAAHRAGLLALLGWLWWAKGLQSVASRLIAQALELNPGLPVAQLMNVLVNEQPPPGVVRAPGPT